MKKKKIKIPLYSGKLIIIQTDSLKKVEKKYDLTSTSGCDAICFRIEDKKGVIKYVVAFENGVGVGVVAHECLHFVNYLFEDSFIKLDANNDEPQAYLLRWAVDECVHFIEGESS